MRSGWKNKLQILGMLAGKNTMDSGCFSKSMAWSLTAAFKSEMWCMC